jgi:hypothetical protein
MTTLDDAHKKLNRREFLSWLGASRLLGYLGMPPQRWFSFCRA